MIVDRRTTSIPSGPVAVVVTYDAVARQAGFKRVRKLLQKTERFDVIALDEGHYLKNPDANRTRAIYGDRTDLANGLISTGLADDGAVWPMSATPQKSNVADMFVHIKALFPQVLVQLFGAVPTFNQFIERYCTYHDGLYGRTITGNDKNTLGELTEALRDHFIVRRKRDVAAELGEVVHIDLPLEISEQDKNKLDSPDKLSEDRTKFLDAFESMSAEENVMPPAPMMQLWRELGEAKVTPAIAWIRDFLDQDATRKLVVFAHHRAVIEALGAAFPDDSVTLYGGTSPKDREHVVERFQNAPNVRLFIGQTIAAGTSITLTAASDVLVLEPEWAALDMYQAISRVHRLGQTDPVTAYYAYADDTVDKRIGRTVKRRTEDFEQLIDGLKE